MQDNSERSIRYLYRYIYIIQKKYRIVYHGTCFASFSFLSDALHERDILEKAHWDFEILDAMDLQIFEENIYENLVLPQFPQKRERGKMPTMNRHIQKVRSKFIVQRFINNKHASFGTYETFNDAVIIRDYFDAHGWKQELVYEAHKFLESKKREMVRL